ncbi:MAG: flavin reductase family protein [Coriobacteriia bacterium]|nr:flavin reductase family protein [Coriobacteriia bacterium]
MSDRIDLGPQGFFYPMPMTLVGADLDTGPNFMPIAWINRVQMSPPRVAGGMNKNHATNAGIREFGEFSVNFPSVDQVAFADWCGLTSAARGVDKSSQFEIVRGSLEHAPMIAECPLSLECRVVQVVDLGSHELFIADIVATWTEERFLDERGKPDITKLRPFTLTMPDNRYWAVGEHIGDAWSIGRTFEPTGD